MAPRHSVRDFWQHGTQRSNSSGCLLHLGEASRQLLHCLRLPGDPPIGVLFWKPDGAGRKRKQSSQPGIASYVLSKQPETALMALPEIGPFSLEVGCFRQETDGTHANLSSFGSVDLDGKFQRDALPTRKKGWESAWAQATKAKLIQAKCKTLPFHHCVTLWALGGFLAAPQGTRLGKQRFRARAS